MKGYLKLNGDILGEVDFKVIDETMGVIGGRMTPHPEYFNYQSSFQAICDNKGIVNSSDYQFKVDIPGVSNIEDGIGLTDNYGLGDIEVEAVGLPFEALSKLI